MDSQTERSTQLVKPVKPPRKPRFPKIRRALRSRTGRIVIPVVTFILGALTGAIILVSLVLSLGGENHLITTSQPQAETDITVQVGPTYLTNLLKMDLASTGMPGKISNVQVNLASGDLMTVTGDDQFTAIITITRQFTVIVQPYVMGCQLHVNIIKADLQGIPVTGFVATFQGNINDQLVVNTSSLPKGFTYCAIAVRTDPQGLYVSYSAKPTS